MKVRSLALLSGLRIWCCRGLEAMAQIKPRAGKPQKKKKEDKKKKKKKKKKKESEDGNRSLRGGTKPCKASGALGRIWVFTLK